MPVPSNILRKVAEQDFLESPISFSKRANIYFPTTTQAENYEKINIKISKS